MKFKNIIIFTLLLLILTFTAGIFVFTLDRTMYYRDYLTFIYDTQRLNQGLQVNKKALLNYVKDNSLTYCAVVIGDSIVEEWPFSAYFDCPVINLGVKGETTGLIRNRFPLEIMPLTPSVIIIQGGLNDIRSGVRTDKNPDAVIASIITNTKWMIQNAKKVTPNVFVISILPVRSKCLLPKMKLLTIPIANRSRINECVKKANQELRNLTSIENVVFVDLFKIVKDESDELDISYAQPGGIHINLKGYETMSKYILNTF